MVLLTGWFLSLAGAVFGIVTAFVMGVVGWSIWFLLHDRAQHRADDVATAEALHRTARSTKEIYVRLHGENPPDLDTQPFRVPEELRTASRASR